MPIQLKLNRPIVIFDLETTGLDFKYDRIVEIAAIKVHPDGRLEKYHKKINPRMRIPAEVTVLTGLKNEDVANCPSLSDVLTEIETFFDGTDIGGYNIHKFDAKVMVEEFKRCGFDFRLEDRKVVDVQTIFHQKEKRDLSAAYKFYCEKDLKEAHSAMADTNATFEILLSQLIKYPDVPRDVEGLDQFCKADRERFVDSEGKFFWRDGVAVFNFGKHKSQSLEWVSQNDPDYLQWVISPERRFPQDVVDLCYDAMKGVFPKKT